MRRLVVLLSTIVALDITFFTALVPLLPHFVSSYGLSKGSAGVLSAAYAAGVLIASLPSGLVAARFGPQRAALVGVVARLLVHVAHQPLAAAEQRGHEQHQGSERVPHRGTSSRFIGRIESSRAAAASGS